MSLFPLGLISQGGGASASNALELISTQVLVSTATSITFSSIPSTYKHLQLRMASKTGNASSTATWLLRANNDSGNNYSYHSLYGTGSSVVSTGAGTYSTLGLLYMNANDPGASVFSTNIVDILDYANTNKNKTSRIFGGRAQSVSPQVTLASGAWYNTAAINRLDLVSLDGTPLSIGSRFSLYGVS